MAQMYIDTRMEIYIFPCNATAMCGDQAENMTDKKMLKQIEARAEQMRNNAEVRREMKGITRKESKEAAERHLYRLTITNYFQHNV